MFILLLIPTCQANVLRRHTGSRFTVAFGGGFHELSLRETSRARGFSAHLF
jgi:hypothetical protein